MGVTARKTFQHRGRREHREKQEEKRISGRKVDVVKGRAVPQ
jgi:hypothetical protein